MGQFNDLQKIADKFIKFKQGKVANNDEAFWSNVDNSMKGGVFSYGQGTCAALSLRFISELLANGQGLMELDDWSFKRDQNSSAANAINQAIYNQAISPQNRYIENPLNLDGNIARIQKMGRDDFKLRPVAKPQASGPNEGFVQFMTRQAKEASESKAALIALLYTKVSNSTNSGHAVALGRKYGRIYFFDSNVGGYRMEEKTFPQFIASYEAVLKSQWTMRSTEAIWFSL